jgi:hypothetical protein
VGSGRGDATEYFRVDAKGRQTNTEYKLVARARSTPDRGAERHEASRRSVRRPQVSAQAPQPSAWASGWGWREDWGQGANWSTQNSWSGNQQQQRFRRGARTFW